MSRKITYDYVKQYFEDKGCKLLATEYISNTTKMAYICKCGNKSEISFNSFQQGSRCTKCGKSHIKHSYDYVKKYFEDKGCKLLATEYINNMTKMAYICSCGNESKTSFNCFQQGHKCRKCSKIKKHSYDYVKQYFEDKGCKLLTTEYIGNTAKMAYICKCGNQSETTFRNFKAGHRCKKCSGYEKYSYDYVKQCFENKGCKLLTTEYTDANTKMAYICKCGNQSEISFNNFRRRKRCIKCKYKK